MHSLGFGFYWFFFKFTMKSHFPSSYHVCDQFGSLLLIRSLLMFLLFLLYLGRGNISSHSSHKEKDFLATYQSTGQVNAQLIGCDLGCIRAQIRGWLSLLLPPPCSKPSRIWLVHPVVHGQGLRTPVGAHGSVLGEVKVPQGTQALIPFSHSIFPVILWGEGYELFAQLLYE